MNNWYKTRNVEKKGESYIFSKNTNFSLFREAKPEIDESEITDAQNILSRYNPFPIHKVKSDEVSVSSFYVACPSLNSSLFLLIGPSMGLSFFVDGFVIFCQ